jgi:RHS repeat-associated protein
MSVSGQIGGTTESASYTYDLLGRLVTSNQTSNGASAQRRFVYDRWGNRTEVWDATSGGTQIQSVTLEQSGGAPTNRLTSVTNSGATVNYSYDSAGSVTSDGVHSYGYDAENRLVSVDGGSTASYGYDHQNRRVKKVVGSTTTHYVWEGWQVIAEHNGSSGAVVSEYIFAGDRMIAREQSGRVFFLQDRLSIRATITDGQGGIQGRQAHLPFGQEFATSGTQDKHRFTNYERDSESGTDHAVNREYSPTLGRFARPDPYGGSYSSRSPQSLSRYAYVENDAINANDPLGLCLCAVYYDEGRDVRWVECFFCSIGPGGIRGQNPVQNRDSRKCQEAVYMRGRFVTGFLNAYNEFFSFVARIAEGGKQEEKYAAFRNDFEVARLRLARGEDTYDAGRFSQLAERLGTILVDATKTYRTGVIHAIPRGERIKKAIDALIISDKQTLQACQDFPEFKRGLEEDLRILEREQNLFRDFLSALEPYIYEAHDQRR